MPALYLGHGAPPLLDDPLWMAQLAGWAADLPTPEADPHRQRPLADRADGHRRHDDRAAGLRLLRLPAALLRVEYRSPGAPELAADVKALMPANEPVLDRPTRGLDHGAWVPLMAMYPEADIPVLQLSMPDLDPRAPVRGRPAARAAARRGRADRRLRVHDPRAAVHRRVLRRPAGRARVVGRVRPLGGRGAATAATSTRCSRSARRRPGCRTPTRPSSTSRRCS